MSQNTLGVLLSPSRYQTAWKAAIAEAANAAGWDVFHHDGQPLYTLPQRSVILSVDARAVMDWPGLGWTIVSSSPRDAVEASWTVQDGWHGAARHASNRLATDHALQMRGWPAFNAASTSIEIQGLGSVLRTVEGETPPVAPPDVVALLDGFSSLEAGDASKMSWGVDFFRQPMSDTVLMGARFDLTGRARILFDGPGIELPPGRWKALVTISVDTEGVRTPLRFDWGQDGRHEEFPVLFSHPGVYRISLVSDFIASGQALLRLATPNGLFQGSVTLMDCMVEHVPNTAP